MKHNKNSKNIRYPPKTKVILQKNQEKKISYSNSS